MKKSIILASLLSASLVFTSCEDWLDVNTDPNKLSELDQPEVVIPTAQVSIANTMMGWDMGLTGAIWSQYYTQSHNASQFRGIEQYQEVSFAGSYTELTAGALNDLKAVKNMALAKEDKGSYLIGEALSIFTWQLLSDTWGTVPYFEALRGDEGIYSPNFDNGDAIYADLIARCDALLAEDFSDATIVEKNDFVFGHDHGHAVEHWIHFVKSLKLKLMLRQSETSSFNLSETVAYVDANAADFLAESAKIDGSTYFIDKDGSRHPQAELQVGGANFYSTNVLASKTFLDYLRVNADPRLASIYVEGDNGQLGAFQGDFFSTEDSDGNGTLDSDESYSTVEFAYNDDLFIMSMWEVYFNVAEVYARNNDAVSAKMYYDAGVEASLVHHGFGDVAIIEAGGYAEFMAGSVEEMVKQISMQRWVAFAKTQHWEAFLERNRTKYPAVNDIDIAANRQDAFINFPVGDLTISVNGRAKLNGNLPASPIYPQSLLQRNNSATKPGQKSDVGEKIWWDQKAGK
ncbi:SusD/RagB family nutrient-binding outer membrane lipoprotein [Sediminitomix flava]|uniref:SusD-like starch-binding protein associating with outer membrane n=1 Tax=Sediminitomix flava TaxID=379075 RepID=A0A315Z7P4_SEDFL|nr:SusD/RagB family nutrient-binding outer membrane lipoprotein [Sediminitomix flava]PWJ40982.1 SusD-like starch-binding protein associating with outer membrane [Sediminitomix flava]